MKSLDKTDEQIIAILSRDARTSNREVARIMGISDTAIRKRLKRLEAIGAAKVTAVINPMLAGLCISTLVRLQTSPESARSVAERAAELDIVSFSALTAGRYNVTALLLAGDQEQLAGVIHSEFRCWEGVYSIDVTPLVQTVKHRLDLIYIKQ